MKLFYIIISIILPIFLVSVIPPIHSTVFTTPQPYDALIYKSGNQIHAIDTWGNEIITPNNDLGYTLNMVQKIVPQQALIQIKCGAYTMSTQLVLNSSWSKIEGCNGYVGTTINVLNNISPSIVVFKTYEDFGHVYINGNNFTNQVYLDVEYNGLFYIDHVFLNNKWNNTGSIGINIGSNEEVALLHVDNSFITQMDKDVVFGTKQFGEDWVHFMGDHFSSSNIGFYYKRATYALVDSSDFERVKNISGGDTGINGTTKITSSGLSIITNLQRNSTTTSIVNSMLWDIGYHF